MLLSIRVAEPWTAAAIAVLVFGVAALIALTLWLIHRH